MFTFIESREEIPKAQRKLESAIRRDFTKKAVRNIGYPGGTTFDASVVTDGVYWYRSADYDTRDAANPRHLNWFGLFKAEGNLQISVEINTAYEAQQSET